jgi:hypothetical protein
MKISNLMDTTILYWQTLRLRDLLQTVCLSHKGNYGPLLVRVVADHGNMSYNAQARADLALEVHSFKDQVTGARRLALLG